MNNFAKINNPLTSGDRPGGGGVRSFDFDIDSPEANDTGRFNVLYSNGFARFVHISQCQAIIIIFHHLRFFLPLIFHLLVSQTKASDAAASLIKENNFRRPFPGHGISCDNKKM